MNISIIIEDDTKGGEKKVAAPDESAKTKEEEATPADDAVAAQLRVYESWFPPMRSVLRILSKIFRVVEPRVFEDIALQSVQSCTKSLKDGSFHILRNSGQIHADLFLVKHLLVSSRCLFLLYMNCLLVNMFLINFLPTWP